jgi:hypothetical protein
MMMGISVTAGVLPRIVFKIARHIFWMTFIVVDSGLAIVIDLRMN